MSAEAVVDTNVLIDAMVQEARKHVQATKLLASLKRMIIPSIVLYETAWVLRKLDLTPEKVASAIEAIVRNPKASIATDDGDLSINAMRLVLDERLELAHFDDKVVLATALRLKKPLATYDKELRDEAERMGITVL